MNPKLTSKNAVWLALALATSPGPLARAQESPTPAPVGDPSRADALKSASPIPSGSPFPTATPADTGTYRITPNDTIRVKVYQEDDLTSDLRISRDGTTTFPLLGAINLGGKTIDEATTQIRDLLARDYLVNPQVTVTVTEYAKRRFTVLGQVGKPGIYDFPNEDGMTLLQAIGMAGGFTRLARSGKVTITRSAGGKKTITVDVKANTNDPTTKQFDVLPDDTISVDERTF